MSRFLLPGVVVLPLGNLFVIIRCLFQPSIGPEIVLNPKLRTRLLEKRINNHSRCTRLRLIELESRHTIQRTLLRIMAKIPR